MVRCHHLKQSAHGGTLLLRRSLSLLHFVGAVVVDMAWLWLGYHRQNSAIMFIVAKGERQADSRVPITTENRATEGYGRRQIEV